MNIYYKLLLMVLLIAALFFGFVPDLDGEHACNVERLHVFLFNLCTGGSVLLYYSEGRRVSSRIILFLVISLAFSFSAFMEYYGLAIICAVLLALITELVRNSRFSFFPWDFFKTSVSVSEKFHHAALLCLSIALIISGVIMAISTFTEMELPPKMNIDIFFLGFSFPVSLITMSLMFSFMEYRKQALINVFQESSFWAVNAGVIVFFVFIILELQAAQAVISILLCVSVIVIFILFRKFAGNIQQKVFLTSGILFLVMTAVTGIGYIILKDLLIDIPGFPDRVNSDLMLLIHRYISLYGWNLTGLFIIIRFDDFPLRMNSYGFISTHWITVILLSPMGKYYFTAGLIAMMAYAVILLMTLFSRGADNKSLS